jgi:hypothetical protein
LELLSANQVAAGPPLTLAAAPQLAAPTIAGGQAAQYTPMSAMNQQALAGFGHPGGFQDPMIGGLAEAMSTRWNGDSRTDPRWRNPGMYP